MEELYLNMKVQVLIATTTVAWGVIVKGSDYYDGKLKRYLDIPITDVLQMIGEHLLVSVRVC